MAEIIDFQAARDKLRRSAAEEPEPLYEYHPKRSHEPGQMRTVRVDSVLFRHWHIWCLAHGFGRPEKRFNSSEFSESLRLAMGALRPSADRMEIYSGWADSPFASSSADRDE